MLVIIVTSGSMFTAPVLLGEYSPAPALVIGGRPAVVRGHVYRWNATDETSGDWIPAVNVDVRIFATDELISEIVTTDAEGVFWAGQSYRSGQVLTLTIEGQRFRAFIPYFPRGMVELGDFFLDS
ncbi:MAG: hypothetical protein ACE5H4_01550 [Candidatus Thorarchaeota archaeon]